MKRIISLVLMFIMLFCIVSCKRRPPDDVTTDVPAQGGTDDAEKPEDARKNNHSKRGVLVC